MRLWQDLSLLTVCGICRRVFSYTCYGIILFIPVIVTRYISVGSLCAYTAFLIEMILFGQWGWFDMEAGYCYELYGIAVLLTALAWYRHRENIKRLVKGTENKFGSKERGIDLWQM